MASIVHMMGPTCAGKSTIIDRLQLLSEDVFTVQIGRLLRMKYGEDYFKGQAAPEHTRAEALELYFDTINEGLSYGKKIILIDGQPRDLGQAKTMMSSWEDHKNAFVLIHADHDIREKRARSGRKPGPDLDLAVARLVNDYANTYTVLVELIAHDYPIDVINTGLQDFDLDTCCKSFLYRYL
jgi:hypothetical protein